MAEETKEETTSEKPEKEVSEETSTEEAETSEKSAEGQETSKPEGASEDALEEKNKRLYARAKKAEEELKAAKEQLEKSKSPSHPEGEDKWKAKVDFLLRNRDKNYSESDFEHISLVAQERGISLDDAAKSEEDYIQYKREKAEKEKQAPEPSTKQPPSEKPFRQVTPQELMKMSIEEKEEYFNKMGWKKR